MSQTTTDVQATAKPITLHQQWQAELIARQGNNHLHGGQNYTLSPQTSPTLNPAMRSHLSTHDARFTRATMRTIALLPDDSNVKPNDMSPKALERPTIRGIHQRQAERLERQAVRRQNEAALKLAIRNRAIELLHSPSAVTVAVPFPDRKKSPHVPDSIQVNTQVIHTVYSAVYSAAKELKVPEHAHVTEEKLNCLGVPEYGTGVVQSKPMMDVQASLACKFPRGFSSAINKRPVRNVVAGMSTAIKANARNLDLATAYLGEVERLAHEITGETLESLGFIGRNFTRDLRITVQLATRTLGQMDPEYHHNYQTFEQALPGYKIAAPRRLNGGIDPFARPVSVQAGKVREAATARLVAPATPARHELMTSLEGALHSRNTRLSTERDHSAENYTTHAPGWRKRLAQAQHELHEIAMRGLNARKAVR